MAMNLLKCVLASSLAVLYPSGCYSPNKQEPKQIPSQQYALQLEDKCKTIEKENQALKYQNLRLEKRLAQAALPPDELQRIYDSFGEMKLILGEKYKLKVPDKQAEDFWKSLTPDERKKFYTTYLNPKEEYGKIEKNKKQKYASFLSKNEDKKPLIKEKLPWQDDLEDPESAINIAIFRIFEDAIFFGL